ncbi:MAG: radical SAM family heme chaperone HemW, partial [Bacillota bacterium]
NKNNINKNNLNKDNFKKANTEKNMIFDFNLPTAIYLHVPFCEGKCRYCSFYSENSSNKMTKKYIEALEKEIIRYGRLIKTNSNLKNNEKIPLSTIYIGGGTPSILKPAQINKIIILLKKYFSEPFYTEITIEANPHSLNRGKLESYREMGINRLSLGVQSFNEQELIFLGRKHNAREALEKIKLAREYFTNLNIDLIFAIPGQTITSWRENLYKAISIEPEHISLYNLQIEEGTALAKELKNGKIEKVDDSLDAQMYLAAKKLLSEKKYNHYEISNFARPSYQSRHNKIYWKLEPYLGLGPAAHSFTGKIRYQNYANIEKYCEYLLNEKSKKIENAYVNNLAITELQLLNKKDLMAEKIFMGMRLLEGVSINDFNIEFNTNLMSVYQKEIEKLTKLTLIEIDNGHLKLSEQGLLHGNRVFMEFL